MRQADIDNPWLKWLGRTEVRTDVAVPEPSAGLAALFDHATPPWRADELPPLGHWLHFLSHMRQSELGADGHPHRGGFLPPIDLPRRMWAGSRLSFEMPIRFGAQLTRTTTIRSITPKRGKAGNLVFVTLEHEIAADSALAVREQQDLVFLDVPADGADAAACDEVREADWSRQLTLDAVALFRFSALTRNTHRIHYDADYARSVERYPALIVHGPLLAMLLLDHWLRRYPAARPSTFEFRARAPAFADTTVRLAGCGDRHAAELFAHRENGPVCMVAKVVEASNDT